MRHSFRWTVFGVIVSCFPAMLQADVVVKTFVSLEQLQILPSSGSVVFLSPWTAQVAVHAEDSISGVDERSGSVTDSSLVLSAATALANADGAASTASVPYSATARSGVNIPEINASASSFSNGDAGFPAYSLFGDFEITGATGPVTVVFQAPLAIDQQVITSGGGVKAFSEASFQLYSPDFTSGGSNTLLFFDNILSIGPNDQQTYSNSPVLATPSAGPDAITLDANTPYFLGAQVDAESMGLNQTPEPSFFVITGLGIGALLLVRKIRHGRAIVCVTALALLWIPRPGQAKYIGGERPKCTGCQCSGCTRPSNDQTSDTSSSLSNSEGNMTESVPTSTIQTANGSPLGLTITYNTDNADGSKATLDTVMGYGWTHSYNIFLFGQLGAMFRYDATGRVTRYQLGTGGTFTTDPGYFETLTQSGGTFTIIKKDQTKYTFTLIPGTPFLVGGPVYRLTQIVDRNGNTTTLTYSSGNLMTVSYVLHTQTAGRTITFTYNSSNHIQTITDPNGNVTRFQYDSTGHLLTQITDPNGKTIQYTYNSLYQITNKVDKAGRIFRYSYNSSLLPVAIYDANSTGPATLSNPNNWAVDSTQLAQNQERLYIPSTTTNTDGRGNHWQYQYDTNGYLIKITAPDGAMTTYTYDPNTLQLASMTDARGNTTSYLYNAEGDLIQVTDALGYVTKYTYETTFHMRTSMTDPRGRVTTYTIDPANGNRIAETDPLGQTKHWAYDGNGYVTQYTDKDGNVTTYAYDAFGDMTAETDAFGTSIQSTTQKQYDSNGNLTQVTDALGRITQYQFDGLNRVIQETDAVGTPQQRTIQTIYDGEGNRIEVIDGRGIITQYQYDLRQRLIQETDAAGTPQQRDTKTSYDGNDNRIKVIDPLGRVATYTYDTRNRLTQETDASGTPVAATTMAAYDAVSNVTSRTDANGHTTTYSYDALNRLSTMTDALGGETLYFYDGGTFTGPITLGGVTVNCNQCGATPGSSLVTEQVDADGTASLHAGTIYYDYDALNRLVIVDRRTGCIAGPSGTGCPDTIDTTRDAVTLYAYDAVGNRLTVTEPDGNTTQDTYDAKNRRIEERNAAGDITITTYDLVNNLACVTAPNQNKTCNTYDALNRVIQVTDSIGLIETNTYDADNNRTSHGDGNGNVTTFTYDALNRVVTATDPLGKTTTTQYDLVGNVLSVTDRNGHVTKYSYDELNRRSTMTDALGNLTKWKYDSVGNLIEIIDGNGNSTSYSYDFINRPLCETYADGTMRCYTYDPVGNLTERQDAIPGQTVKYTYSDLYFLTDRAYTPSGAGDTFTYDLSGRMLTNDRLNGTFSWAESFSYDGANRVLTSVQDGRTVGYSYNIPSRIRMVTYPGGRTITENTDFRARLDHINSSPSIVQYSYDLANNMLTRDYANGTTSAYTYNANNWMTSIAHENPSTFAGFNYTYDNEGNKNYEQKTHDPSHSECYSYDAVNRLIDYGSGTLGSPNPCPVVAPPTPPTQTSYSLDAVGNWKSKTTNGVTETRTHNSVNEITKIDSTSLSYDPDGDLTNDGTYTYTYDEEHRLASATCISATCVRVGTVVGQYQYDALSRRVQKIADPAGSATTTLYFYDDARIIEEENNTFATQATYVYGNYIDEILTMDRGGATYYYHQNALWSVEAVTNSSGIPVERYRYDAYGLATITDGAFNPIPPNPWGTPHSAIGNPWMFTGRELDEETGLYYYRARYYSPRLGRFLERDPIEDGLNLYAYVEDRPTFATDPTGLKKCCVDSFDTPAARSGQQVQDINALVPLPAGVAGPPAPVLVAQRVFESFEMRAKFKNEQAGDAATKDCCCECCEYRQFVRGEFKANGVVVAHRLATGLLSKTVFAEDGLPAPTGLAGYGAAQPAFYGHRADPGFANDVYCDPNRATGCTYIGKDAPGISGGLGTRLEAHLEFRGVIIDTCNRNREIDRKEWKVDLDHTVPAR